eukprot:356673-Chlamydomonas_euryale.AAC.7
MGRRSSLRSTSVQQVHTSTPQHLGTSAPLLPCAPDTRFLAYSAPSSAVRPQPLLLSQPRQRRHSLQPATVSATACPRAVAAAAARAAQACQRRRPRRMCPMRNRTTLRAGH